MRTGRSYVATAIAIGAITLAGCAADLSGGEAGPPRAGDWGDEDKYPDLGEVFQGLSSGDVTSTFDSTTGELEVEIAVSKAALFVKRAVDSAILVNGVAVVDTVADPDVTATSSTVKSIAVTVNTPAGVTNETAIVDFLGGTFATATEAETPTVTVDLGAGAADVVSIRGTSAKDSWYIGDADELSLGNDDNVDVSFTGVETVNLALASGDDVFSATNAAAIKGVENNATIALVVYGGGGKDTITGGDGIDKLYGGLGDDTLNGAAAADELYGEEGSDTVLSGVAADGADEVSCGTDAVGVVAVDVVSYVSRTAAVSASLYQAAATDLDGAGSAPTTEDDFTAKDCETLLGGTVNDILFGNGLVNTISGGAGNDTLAGFAGNDTLNGDAGDDTFDEKSSADVVDPAVDAGGSGKGTDVFNGGAGVDLLDYSSRTATLTITMDGKAGDDGESGEKDNVKADVENLKCGTSGAATVTGNSLDNTLFEGATKNGNTAFAGGAGVDTVDYSLRTLAITVTMGDNTANDGDTGNAEADNVKSDVENVLTGNKDDLVTGNDLDNYIDLGVAAVKNYVVCGGGDDLVLGAALNAISNPHNCEISEGSITAAP